MVKKYILIIIASFLLISHTFAETTIKAEVDKKEITTDDVLTYKITIVSADKKIPSPVLPKTQDFSIISRLQSTSLTFSKGESKNTAVFVFLLAPRKAGEFQIGPSKINVNGKVMDSESFKIKVKKGKLKLKIVPEQKPSKPGIPTSEEDQVTL